MTAKVVKFTPADPRDVCLTCGAPPAAHITASGEFRHPVDTSIMRDQYTLERQLRLSRLQRALRERRRPVLPWGIER